MSPSPGSLTWEVGYSPVPKELGRWQVAVVVTDVGWGVDQEGSDLSPRRLLGLDLDADPYR